MTDDYRKGARYDWDRRARADARRAIVSGAWRSEEEFDRSGERSVGELLDGLKNIVHKDMAVLDIGCGIGRIDKFLADIFKEVHGVDVSEEMIKLGKERLKEYSNIFLHVNNGMDISLFRTDIFDLVFSILTFDHIPRKYVYNYFRETFRVLKPNGIFKFQVVDRHYWFFYLLDFVKYLWNQYHSFYWGKNDAGPVAKTLSQTPYKLLPFVINLVNPYKEPSDDDTYTLRWYNKAELRNALCQCGFTPPIFKNKGHLV